MSFLLDTDICSAYLKGVPVVFDRFSQYSGQLRISVATLGELLSWTIRLNSPARRRQSLEDLLAGVTVLDVAYDIAFKFGELRAGFLDRGQNRKEFDLLIAATALVHDLTLVTHNVADFADIPGLCVIDWLAP